MKVPIVLTLLGASSLLACASVTPASPGAEQLALGGIVLGQSESSVISALGKPPHREDVDGFLPIVLKYQDFEVRLDDDGVGGIHSTNPNFCTPANICPGMTYSRLQQEYGPSRTYERDGAVFRDYMLGDGCWLRFTFQGDIISVAEALCSP